MSHSEQIELQTQKELTFQTNMQFWYTRIKHLPIPMPKTTIISRQVTLSDLYDKQKFEVIFKEVEKIVKEYSYPFFIRTDLYSAKHNWDKTCFIVTKDQLRKNLFTLLEETLNVGIIGLPINAIVIRAYIEMFSSFKAFSGLPISAERRYFIEDGKVICHHPYWIKDSILRPSKPNWESLLEELNKEEEKEIVLLTGYAKEVSKQIRGYWSVDFCKSKEGKWYLIDMARAELSWHPSCPLTR